MKQAKRFFTLSSIAFLIALTVPFAVPHVIAATGLVCMADPSVNPSSCPTSPATITGPMGSNVSIAVNIQASDTVNGFDVSTIVDSSVLQPVGIVVANSIIHDPKTVLVQSVDPNSGIARYAAVALGYSITGPVTGNLFNIVYRVLTSNRGTGIVFQTGCSGTSVPNTCVTVTSPNVDSETVQNGALSGPVTPNFAISASIKSQTLQAGSSTSTNMLVNSLNGFTGTVNLSTSPPPLCPSCPTWSISPTSVSVASGGAARATLTFQTTSGTPPNTYNVAVNGTSGSLSHSVFLSFTVTAPPPPPDFSMSANPASQNVQSGSTATSSIVLTSLNGFSGTVSLSVPPQLTCPSCPGWSISPTSVTLSPGGTASSTLTFTTFAGGPTGTFHVNATGTSGSLSHFTVASFTIVSTPPPSGVVCIADASSFTCPSRPVMFQGTVGGQLQVAVNVQNSSALNGFDVQVLVDPTVLRPVNDSLAGTVLPSPIFVVANSVNSTSGRVRVAAVSQGGLTAAPTTGRFFSITYNVVGATAGSFILFPGGCSGTSDDSICVTVTNPNMPGGVDPESVLDANFTSAPDFTMSANPSSLSIPAGTTANSTITISSINGFSGTVSLHTSSPPLITCPPSCSTWSISPTSVTPSPGGSAKAILSITVSSFGGGGSGSTITVFGTSGTFSHSTQVVFTVVPPPAPTFSIGASPASLSIIRGGSASSAINVTSLNGFTGTVSLSATISPVVKKGPVPALTPTSITLASGGTATATLLVTTGGGTPTGTYTVSITATSGSITKTTTITVTILPHH